MKKVIVIVIVIVIIVIIATVVLLRGQWAEKPAHSVDKEIRCLKNQREADICAEIYAPVCANVQIQCIKAPCYPIKETFGNSCEACQNPLVDSYNEGACKQTPNSSYKDATYVIAGKAVKLTNGISETEETPDSTSKIITRYFGNEVRRDLDNDGREDIVFLLTQETGGSGIFFYVVAALNTINGYIGSEAIFLGDRIAPQTIHMDEEKTARGTNRKNVIVVNYAIRLPGEPFTSQVSLGKSLWLKLDPITMQLGEVAQNFEGESR